MIEKITDQNLERYDSRLKEWCDRKFFEKGNYGKYQTTEESGAVAFYPAPNTPLEGKVKFSFTETPPASGDKGPENPSMITGMSSINITRCSKNILAPKVTGTTTTNGITITSNGDGTYTLNGTTTDQIFYHLLRLGENWFQEGITYTAKANASDLTPKIQMWTGNSTYGGGFFVEQGTFTSIKTIASNPVAIYVAPGKTFNNVVVKPQIEIDSQATDFEVGTGDVYTLPLGSTYYGGSLDVATGVMTVTYVYVAFTGSEQNLNWGRTEKTATVAFNTAGAVWLNILPKPKNPANGPICTHFPFSYNASLDTTHFYVYSTGHVVFYYPDPSFTVEDWKSYLATQYAAGTPVTVCYEASIPLATIQLTPTQICSLAQADKYTPRLNTVYTDADSIQISYLKSLIRDEYEKTQAILSLGGNS